MSKRLPLFVKITSIILLVVLAQISTSFAQRNPRNTIAGEKTYIARPMPYDNLLGGGNVDAAVKAGTSHIKGFAATGTTGLITCITESGREIEKVKYVYRLFLDEESLESSLTTNQRSKTAKIKLVGNMRIWEQKFVKNDPNCKVEFEEIDGGKGGLDITMRNKRHVTPLNFMAGSASGRVYGPVMNDSLGIASGSNPPTYVNSVDTGFVKKLIPKQNQQLSPEALKRMGINLPPGALEQLKQNQNIAKSTAPDHRVDGILKGASKDKALAFVITTGFDADMLVYKPKAMASSGGGGGGSSANFKSIDSNNSLLNSSFFRKVNYVSSIANTFSNSKENSINAFKTRDSGGIFVNKRNRDKVQAFVNLDNDDKNENFDLDDEEKMADKDNDMVKVILRIKQKSKPQRKGIAEFKVEKGDTFVNVWERENSKSDKLKKYTSRKIKESDENEFKEGTGDFKGFLIKELWIEGKKAQTKQKQTKFKFVYYESPRSLNYSVEEEFDLTVLGIENIEFEAKDNGVEFVDKLTTKPANALDTDPNHVHQYSKRPLETKGVRVFPGKRLLSAKLKGQGCSAEIVNRLDIRPRDKVDVKVTLSVEPVEPVKVYFDSFDVDDPTASGEGNPGENSLGISKVYDDESWIDNELNASDNRGKVFNAIHPHTGKLVGEDSQTGILAVEFSGKEETFEFQVTKQPGDNFRIVGSGSEDYFENLENDESKLNYGGKTLSNNHKQRVVDKFVLNSNPKYPDKAEVRESEKYVSDTLAVWRIFYGERDYMGPVTGNSVEGKIVSISHSLFSNTSTVQLDKNIRLTFKLIDNKGLENSFEKGKLTVAGKKYEITSNTSDYTKPDSITVVGKVPKNLVKMEYEIVDDDKSQYDNGAGYHFGNGGVLWNPEVEPGPGRNGVDHRFAPAYIVSDFGTLKNACLGPKFAINVLEDKSSSYESHYRFDNKDLHTNKDFWTVYILGSFQATSWEDGDPNSEGTGGAASGVSGITAGYADTSGMGVTIFLAGVIEKNDGKYVESTENGRGEQDAIVHEIGHLFNAQHGQGRLMDQEHNMFSNQSIAAIRDSENP